MKRFKALVCAVSVLTCAGLFTGCGGGNGDEKDETPACAHTNLTKVDGKDATCYEEGNYVYYECECGELFSDKNAQRPTTSDDVKIEKLRHDMHRYEELVGSYNGYYFCNSCGRYYEDFTGNSEIPYSNFADSSVAPVALPNGWADPAGANTENRDFTIRCFIGWTNEAGKTFTDFPDSGTVWVNGNLTKVAPEFTDLCVKQGGIWVRVVRQGTNCSFYFEDKYGIPILISTNAHFDGNEALYRFAFGQAEQVNGWTQSSAKSEICWGIANPRCVFSEQ